MDAFILFICVVCFFVANIYQSKFSATLEGLTYPMNFFQATWMLIAAAVFCIFELFTDGLQFSGWTLAIAPIAGVITVLGGMSFLGAMASGPLSLTILIFSMYVVIPSLLAIPFLGESVTTCQMIGLIIVVIVLFLTNFDGDAMGKRYSKKWWFLCIASVFCTGTSSFLQRVHQSFILRYAATKEQREYSIVSFLAGIAVALLFILITKPIQDRKPGAAPYRFAASTFFLPAIMLAVTQGGANLCNLYLAGSKMPAIIQYPVSQLGALMMTAVYAMIFLHEKPSKLTKASLTLGVAAIILMNF